MKKLLLAIIICAFGTGAWASDFNFYGSLRFQTFNEEYSKETNSTGANTALIELSDRDTKWGTLGTSRIGAKIKLSDKISGLFELGVGDEDLTLRLFFGEYNFGSGKILIGQAGHPLGASYSTRAGLDDGGLMKYGVFYGGLVEMIKFTFDDFQLMFIEPTTNLEKKYDTDTTYPQIAASYDLKYENISFDAVGTYQTYEAEDHAANNSFDVDTYVVRLGIKSEFGPAMLGATYGWGQNVQQLGNDLVVLSSSGGMQLKFDNNGKLQDIDTKGYTIVGSYQANDRIRFETGYGYVKSEIDSSNIKDDASSYYLQANIKIADGFVLTPEIGKVDYKKSAEGKDDGDMTYFGAKWQIDF